MSSSHEALIRLFDELGGSLEQLAALAREKIDAVKKDDLLALDEVIKQEQAYALKFRSMDNKRSRLLKELGLERVPLHELAAHFPPELQLQVKKSAESLRDRFRIYQSAAEVSRHTLECNLHEIEKLIESAGRDPGLLGGDPPAPMKTDFRI